jgi:transposase
MMNADTLPKTVAELQDLLLEREARNRERIEFLEERVRLLLKALFGRKTEKRPQDEEGVRQLHLFNEAEELVAKESEQPPLVVPQHTRGRPKRKPLPAELPRMEVVHDIPEADKICGCGEPLCRIGEEVSEKLDIIPAKVQVIRNIRPKYVCKKCQGVETQGPTVKVAPPQPEIIPKGIATPGLLAHIAVAKYADALPLYRQEKIFARSGIELSRSTMAGWMVKVADACGPIMELLRKELLCGPLINADETPVQVLKEPGRPNTSTSYMWVFRGGHPQKPVIIYRYSTTRSGEVPREMLKGYKGYCQTDAFSAYDALEKAEAGIRLVGCFAHARRNFVNVIDARSKAKKQKPGSAEVALDYIRKLYAVERTARQGELTPEQIQVFRQPKAEPILQQFKAWMGERVSQTPPQGLLGKALNYALSHWSKLIRYLEDGHITPDNNAVENAIRPFAIGRKNWLFAGHPNGAHAAATIFSLIETAKACGLEPYRYLRLLFERLPYAQSEQDFKALLPQFITPDRPQLAVIEG